MPIELSAALLAGILSTQIVQIGFEAQLLKRITRVETQVDERTTPISERGDHDV